MFHHRGGVSDEVPNPAGVSDEVPNCGEVPPVNGSEVYEQRRTFSE